MKYNLRWSFLAGTARWLKAFWSLSVHQSAFRHPRGLSDGWSRSAPASQCRPSPTSAASNRATPNARTHPDPCWRGEAQEHHWNIIGLISLKFLSRAYIRYILIYLNCLNENFVASGCSGKSRTARKFSVSFEKMRWNKFESSVQT